MGAGKAVIAGLFVLSTVHDVRAQTVDQSTTIDCILSAKHGIMIERGSLKEETDTSKPITITFTNFDPVKSSASLVGNAGAVSVFYDERDGILAIYQVFGSAVRTMTTMSLPRPGQQVQSVHSRHTWLPGTHTGIISQWGGPCRLR